MNSLKSKTIKGVSWSLIDNIANSGIAFLVGIVLARILSDKEFGIIGIVTIFIAISNSIIDSGLSNALIRKTDAKDIDYNTVFFSNLSIGIILYLILFFWAPALSSFFKEPILLPVLRVIGLILIFNALSIIQRTLLVKRVDFKKQAQISLISSIISGIIGIIMALNRMGVWSLVGQQMSRQLLNSLLLWLFNKWRPHFEFSVQSFKELFGFGSKLLISGLISTLYNNIYYLVIGKFYSKEELGQFTRAEQFSTILSNNLTTAIQRVSYPVLCEFQNNPEVLVNSYQKIIKSTMLVTFACMLALAAIAQPLIAVLLGDGWSQAAEYLPILCLSGMLYPLHAINLNILQVTGRSDLFLRLEIIKKSIGILTILIGIFISIKAMLWANVGTSILAFFINSYYSARLINYSTWKQIKDLLPTLIVSLLVAFFMWCLNFINMPNWFILILQLSTGAIMTHFIYTVLKLPEYIEIKKMFISFVNKKAYE